MLSLKSFRPARLSVSPTVHQWLLLSSGFSCLLLLVRILVTGSTAYIFLPWNLLLAFVPYWITWLMTRDVSIIENKTKLILSLLIWLLFFPNSFYIITDLFHLTHVTSAPRWFDLLLIFSFAWNGMVCGLISMRRVEVVITALKGNSYALLFIFGVMWLSAFGIYIGRFLRFNSWDVLTDPFSLAAEITDMIIHPIENMYAWSMTMCYAVFMTLLYCTVKKLTESFGSGK
jgi:uncharacterized membrane protein